MNTNKPEFSEELKQTYYPYWEEMKEILARYPYPSPEFVSELHSILNRSYINALEVGFNEGLKFGLDQHISYRKGDKEMNIGPN